MNDAIPKIANPSSATAIIPNTNPAIAIPFPPFFIPITANIIANIAHGN